MTSFPLHLPRSRFLQKPTVYLVALLFRQDVLSWMPTLLDIALGCPIPRLVLLATPLQVLRPVVGRIAVDMVHNWETKRVLQPVLRHDPMDLHGMPIQHGPVVPIRV